MKPENPQAFKVGDEVWLFDTNWRQYKPGQSAPIYESHFRKFKIDGETSRSWVVCDNKYPKNNPRGLYTDKQKEDKIWDNDNRYRIVNLVERCDGDILKEIDNLLSERSKGVQP